MHTAYLCVQNLKLYDKYECKRKHMATERIIYVQ